MRPKFHFTADSGWINDPHGITVKDGKYHLFYQYVPDSMVWGPNWHWGHAAGSNLFELEHLPVALAPGDGDGGIWTGSLVADDGGTDRIFYTSTSEPDYGIGRIRAATSTDTLLTWTKGPILADAPSDLDVIAYRDPFVFRGDEDWRMLVGAGLRDGTAAALAYSSPDLDHWHYEGVAASRSTSEHDPVWMGALWECPQLFEIDGRHVLISSVWDNGVLHYAGYGIGTYHDGRFTADAWGRLSFGRCYYAPSFFHDAAGRPCLSFWMRGVRDDTEGWSSAHSIPHVLALHGDRLTATPHPDLDQYALGTPSPDGTVPGAAADISWTPQPVDQLVVRYGDQQVLRIEITNDLLVAFGAADPWTMPYTGGPVRLLLDGPTAELSTGDGILGTAISSSDLPLTVTSTHAPTQVRPLQRKAT